jgi:very-short-patch-repair endonuclease
VATTDISKIVGDFARATMKRIVEIDGNGPRMTGDEMKILA